VTNSDIVADDAGVAATGNMNGRIILDICSGADSDVMNIGANYGIEPNTAVFADDQIADESGTAGDKNIGA
jgi:hypothetical protein